MTPRVARVLTLVGLLRAARQRASQIRFTDPVAAARLMGSAYLIHDQLDAFLAQKD